MDKQIPTYKRYWAMPNKETFKILPIRHFIRDGIIKHGLKENMRVLKVVDMFCGNISHLENILTEVHAFTGHQVPCTLLSNDLNPDNKAQRHDDAYDFLKLWINEYIDIALFDPPYSPRQVAECYKGVGHFVTQQDTQATFWSKCKKEIARITKPSGLVFSFGWNSNGIGKKLGFEFIDGIMVAHGGNHNDTICTLERKIG